MKRLAIAILPLLVACSGPGSTGTGYACPALGQIVTDPVISPANGSTGVPTGVGTLRFPRVQPAIQNPVVLTPTNGSAAIITTTPPRDDPATGTVVVDVPTLAAHTTYMLNSSTTIGGGPPAFCSSYVSYNLGSFTTQ